MLPLKLKRVVAIVATPLAGLGLVFTELAIRYFNDRLIYLV